MAHKMINVLLTSFPGLNLPSTLSLPVSPSLPISDLTARLSDRLPLTSSRFILTTNSNKEVTSSSAEPVSTLLSSADDTFLPLRLSVPLCGGKGGFGSQLRAAGGRMSSRRKKNQGENNGSNRNLDGRRLRTINEAKALAEYLALKPEMEKKEKDARRKRWEQVVELAERREEEVRSGSKGRVDGKWVEDKEEVAERTREAVLAVMQSGNYTDNFVLTLSESLAESFVAAGDSSEGGSEGTERSCLKTTTPPSTSKSSEKLGTRFFGFDDDEQFMSDEDEVGQDEVGETASGQNVNGGVMAKGRSEVAICF